MANTLKLKINRSNWKLLSRFNFMSELYLPVVNIQKDILDFKAICIKNGGEKKCSYLKNIHTHI